MGVVNTSTGPFSVSKNITVTNTGKGVLVISAITKTSFSGPSDAFSVSGGVGSIQAGQTATIVVTFRPRYLPLPPTDRTYTANFSIVSNAYASPTPFTATGIGASLD